MDLDHFSRKDRENNQIYVVRCIPDSTEIKLKSLRVAIPLERLNESRKMTEVRNVREPARGKEGNGRTVVRTR